MQADCLHLYLDQVASNGLVLSPEQKTTLQISMEIVKKNYKFSRVYFWGKIMGLTADYFIVQGVETDELRGRKSLYSLNCMDWMLLPPATDEMIDRSFLVKGRFMGDPSHEYESITVKTTDEETTDLELKVKEEERLTATIEQINREAAIIPRGAFIKTPHEQIHKNRSFEGLSVTEAGKLRFYLHFTTPFVLKKKSLLMQANVDESIDFLNSLDDDELKVIWSLQYEKGSKLVILRNLLWLGFTFFHVPETSQYGCLYMGLGEKNMDFPFMI
ncbi:radial spoke head protein 9 homolog [Heterodontus francisci]|uniref:radial spoke head protein 9 homolog n=1 Tax=Heterodontus francisci TaxID=7792 RepID=UPI00355B8D26